MTQEVRIAVQINKLDGESGNTLIFKVPFKQLVHMLIESARAMAKDFNNPLRLYATSVFSILSLFVSVLDDDYVEIPERVGRKVLRPGEKEEILGDWHTTYRGKVLDSKSQKVVKKRKKRVCGKRPSDEQLLEFRRNGAFHKDIAKLYGVDTSTVCGWVKNIKQA